jgi:hypothetical protein
MSGLAKIADPWDQLINFYRSVSNTAVAYEMIHRKLEDCSPVFVSENHEVAYESR